MAAPSPPAPAAPAAPVDRPRWPRRAARGLGCALLAVARFLRALCLGFGRALLAVARFLRLLGRAVGQLLVGTGRAGRQVARWSRDDGPVGRQVRAGLPWVLAVLLAAIAFGTSGTVYDVDRFGWGLMPFVGALAGLPFGLVAVRPLVGWAVSVGTAFVLAVVLDPTGTGPWPWLVVHGLVMLALLLAVCARSRLRVATGAWLVTCALFAWGVPGDVAAGWLVAVSATAVIGVLAGRLVLTNVALDGQRRVAAEEKAQRLVLEERTRIARDLHDIVAHHMSLIVVQTETAAYRVPDLGDQARAELASISASAREALTETRSMLSLLRREDEPAAHAPQPGGADLADLVEAVRRAGVPVEARIDPVVTGLRPATALAVYRILQESLANAARHAPGSRVDVTVAPSASLLTVEVRNAVPAGPAGVDRSAEGPGHGILGMRERAAAEGGTLSAGRTPGGFEVVATIPLPGEAG